MIMKEPRNSFYHAIEDDAEAQRWLDMRMCWPTRIDWENIPSTPYEHVGRGLDATYLVCTKYFRLPFEVQKVSLQSLVSIDIWNTSNLVTLRWSVVLQLSPVRSSPCGSVAARRIDT